MGANKFPLANGGGGRYVDTNISVLLATCLLLAQVGREVSANQQTQPQQQPQAQANSQQQSGDQNSMSQPSAGPMLSFGGEYSLIGANGDGVLPSGGFNSKRARKMSAFMPMRGRKDGRDDAFAMAEDQLLASQQTSSGFPWASIRESDGGDASILRLVTGGNNYDSQQPLAGANQRASRFWAPRQFANQLAVQHNQQQQQQQPPQAQPAPSLRLSYESADPSTAQFGPMEGVALVGEPAGVSPVGLMQAKWRRAFHPMRGKKSSYDLAAPAEFGAASKLEF